MSSTGLNLSKMASSRGTWLRQGGPHAEIAISSRIRLARNLAGFPFLTKCSEQQKNDIQDLVVTAINGTDMADSYVYIKLDEGSHLEKQLLVERHLISRQHADGDGPRGAAIIPDETVAMMVNEEDHLRTQVLFSGLQLAEAWERINSLDDQLEQHLEFAFDERLGYLTACPTNVGTGIRVSVMLHLPALKLTGEIERVLRAARDMNLAIRGLHGEGTEATGDFYQVSNQTTLGSTEEQIVEEFMETIVPKITAYELNAREVLVKNKKSQLEDKVYRAVGMLRYARTMSSEETLFLLSQLRMGVHMGLVTDIDLDTINELFLTTQPAHLQVISGKKLDDEQRSALRAQHIRERLNDHQKN